MAHGHLESSEARIISLCSEINVAFTVSNSIAESHEDSQWAFHLSIPGS